MARWCQEEAEGLQVWRNEERAVLLAFLSSYKGKVAGHESVLETGGESGSGRSDGLLLEGTGLSQCGVGV